MDGVYSLGVKCYIEQLIINVGLQNAKVSKKPMDPGFLKNSTDGEASASILEHKFAAPTEIDWTAAKRVIRYLKETIDWRLKLRY